MSQVLDDWKAPVESTDGRFRSGTGQLRNLKIIVGLDSIFVSGSPARFTDGVNLWEFGPDRLTGFLHTLADLLGVNEEDLRRARISKLDVALNVVMDFPPSAYFGTLVSKPRTKTLAADTTRYFINGSRLVRCYDKIAEIIDKRRSDLLSPGELALNVLRLEVSTRRMGTDFKPPLTLGSLATQVGWQTALTHWKKHYDLIHKAEIQSTDPSLFLTPSTKTAAVEMYASFGINQSGGIHAALDRVNASRARGEINRHQSLAVRKKLRSVHAGSPMSKNSSLLAELNTKTSALYIDAMHD